MSIFENNKISDALKEYKFKKADTPPNVTFSKEFETKMGRVIRQKQRNYNVRVFTQRAAAAVITLAVFGSFFYLLLLPRNAEEIRPMSTIEELEPDPEPAPDETTDENPSETPNETTDALDDPCDCCLECTQAECTCGECGDNEDCECSVPEDLAPSQISNDAGVEVSTAEELLGAISPNATITLEAGQYDVSTLFGLESPYIQWKYDSYDLNEKTLVISGVNNLTLQAAPGAEVEIVTPWRFAEVLSFSNCSDISLIGIKAGHTVTGDYECDEGVVSFNNCTNITVENCYFYGCGSVGINMSHCRGVSIKDTIITDCSRAALIIDNSKDIEFSNCRLIDNRAYQYVVCIDNSAIIFIDCKISGNKRLGDCVIEIDFFGGSSNVLFDSCTITDNAPNMDWYEGGAVFKATSKQYAFAQATPYIAVRDCEIELGVFSQYWSNDDVTNLGGTELN